MLDVEQAGRRFDLNAGHERHRANARAAEDHVNGVPADSHFARVLVAADYRMKRLAMNFDPSPVNGLPSYLHMIKPGAARHAEHAAALVAGAELRVAVGLARRTGVGNSRRQREGA